MTLPNISAVEQYLLILLMLGTGLARSRAGRSFAGRLRVKQTAVYVDEVYFRDTAQHSIKRF